MKHPEFVVRASPDAVSVEHRGSVWQWLLPMVIVFVFATIWGAVDGALEATAATCIIIGTFAFAVWLRSPIGETMHCDRTRVLIARRGPWGRWKRESLPATGIQRLRRETRARGRSVVGVVTFTCAGRDHDMFEDMSREDTSTLLKSCEALGIDVFNPPIQGEEMLRDIEKRGWWQNPLKPDR